MTATIVAGRLVLEDRVAAGRLTVDDGLISTVEVDVGDVAADAPYLAPGFVDVYVHGWGGHDAMGDEALQVMRRRRGGEQLLAYRDGRVWKAMLPQLVNEYVREVTGVDATAKDFRTWHATVLAAAALAESPEAGSVTARKRVVAAAMREVSEFLGNTPALARSSYVDPRVVSAYEEGRTIARATSRTYATPDERQLALERATLRLIALED